MKKSQHPSSFSSYRGSDADFSKHLIDFSGYRVRNNPGYNQTPKQQRENRKKEQLMEGN